MGWFEDYFGKDSAGGQIIRAVGSVAGDAWDALVAPGVIDTSNSYASTSSAGTIGRALIPDSTGKGIIPDTTHIPRMISPNYVNPEAARVTQEDVGGVVERRSGRGSGMHGSKGGGVIAAGKQVPNVLADLEAQRQAMEARRNAAIAAAGRGAGAPYSAAIARLDRDIAQTQAQLGRMGPLFDNKREINRIAYDFADTELRVAADEALAEMELINKQTYNALAETWSTAQSSAAGVLDKIGADDATRAAVAEEVGYLEDEIMEMNEIDATSRSRILQASEDLAVAAAAATGATNKLELTRNQIMVEGDLKEKINNMIEDRKQSIAARNAAVSAARALEAARWPENAALDRDGYAQTATIMALERLMGGASDSTKQQVGSLVELFSQYGVSKSHAARILRDPKSAGNIASRYGISQETLAEIGKLPSNILRSASSHVPLALDTYEAGLSYYDREIGTKDPWDLPAGSASQYMSAYNKFLSMNMSEPDARASAKDYADRLANGEDMSELNRLLEGRGR